jgi:hypothetical protein
MLLAVALPLALAAPAWSITLDREGTKVLTSIYEDCPNVKLTKAVKDSGGNARYGFEGMCIWGLIPYSIKAELEFKWISTFGNAREAIVVTGPGGGQIVTKVTNCNKDPFVSPGVYNCTGEKAFNSTFTKIKVHWVEKLPLFAGSVPASQVGTVSQPLTSPLPPPPPPEPGLVKIVSPTQNQAIPISKGSFEVKFEEKPNVMPKPDGAVKLEWQRFVTGSSPYGAWVPHPGPPTYVEYYKMTQVVSIKDSFPNPGKYRVRAMASPLKQWTPWREFSIISFDPSLVPKVPTVIKPKQ